MAGILGALNAGKTALQANQVGLEITGNNIANVNTKGYSRQEAIYSNVPTFSHKNFFIGQGVRVSAVQRDHDHFLEKQLTAKTAEYGFQRSQNTPLSELERVFPIGDDNLSTDIGNYFDSLQKLSVNPSDQVLRNNVLHKGHDLSVKFNNTAKELPKIQDNISQSVISKIDGINDNLTEVAELNSRIQTIEATGQSANAQRDRQEDLIKELAQTVGAEIISSKTGMLSLHLPGGLPLVHGTSAASISYKAEGSSLSLELNLGNEKKSLNKDIVGGEIKGLLTVQNETIPGLLDSLDKLAFDITNEVNAQHALGKDRNGNQGGVFFSIPPNDNFASNSTKPEHDGAARFMSVAITDGNKIAAGNTAAPGDNENALALADLRHIKDDTNDTFTSKYGKLTSTVGTAKSRNEIAMNGAKSAMEQVQNLKDSASGVSLEEEMINLIQFQRSFQSSAKFLSTVDEMMGTLINLR